MIDYYTPTGSTVPEIMINDKIATRRVLNKLKKVKATHLLHYFKIEWSIEGEELTTCAIPGGFTGLVLNQINMVLEGE